MLLADNLANYFRMLLKEKNGGLQTRTYEIRERGAQVTVAEHPVLTAGSLSPAVTAVTVATSVTCVT